MKSKRSLSISIVTLAFMLAASVAAKAKDSAKVLLHNDATVAGSHLPSGSYKIEWEANTPTTTVTFSQGKKAVATVTGKVMDRGTKYASTQVVYNTSASGMREVQEIRLGGSSEALVFTE